MSAITLLGQSETFVPIAFHLEQICKKNRWIRLPVRDFMLREIWNTLGHNGFGSHQDRAVVRITYLMLNKDRRGYSGMVRMGVFGGFGTFRKVPILRWVINNGGH